MIDISMPTSNAMSDEVPVGKGIGKKLDNFICSKKMIHPPLSDIIMQFL